VHARVRRDAAFRGALLCEGVNALLAGDVSTGKSVLRDYINGTLGFEALGAATGIARKPNADVRTRQPAANNLFAVLSYLQRHARVRVG
jgi:hypothetical protein